MTGTEKANKIAKKWGWELEELLEFLSNGGSAGITGVSASQAAHSILLELLDKKN